MPVGGALDRRVGGAVLDPACGTEPFRREVARAEEPVHGGADRVGDLAGKLLGAGEQQGEDEIHGCLHVEAEIGAA